MNENPEKKTNYQFKVLYAIGIIFVVAGHAGADSIIFWNELIHCAGYYMAMFVFASGYFYDKKNDTQPVKYILRKAKHLLIPYILWNCFYGLLVLFLSKFGFTVGLPVTWEKLTYRSLLGFDQFDYNTSSWFVIPLFMTEVYTVILRFIFRSVEKVKKDIIFLLISFFIGFAGIYLAMKGFDCEILLFFTRVMYFVPFYALGNIYYNYLEKRDTLSSFWYFAIIILISLTFILVIGHSPFYLIVEMQGFENPVFPYLVGIVGIAFWLRIARILTPVIGESKILNEVADNTYSIMVNHVFGFMMVKLAFYVVASILPFLPKVDLEQLKTVNEYIYLPRGRGFPLVYVFFGILISVLMNKTAYCLKNSIFSFLCKREKRG